MRVLFLATHPKEIASTRYRVLQYFPHFAKHGIDCTFQPFFTSEGQKVLYERGFLLRKLFALARGITSRLWLMKDISDYDAIFVHEEAFPLNQSFYVKLLERSNNPIIYDLDDAFYLPQRPRRPLLALIENPAAVQEITRISNYVIAGNKHLRNYARRFNHSVVLIPTCVDTDVFTPKEHSLNNRRVLLGWVGSHSSSKYLLGLKEVLQEISSRFDVTLLVVGAGRELSIPGLKVVNERWQLINEIEYSHSIDIGLYPLTEDEWALGKCGFKAIQYMAAGIPCVASAVGANNDIIRDGYNGFLARNEQEWIDKLTELIENPELRQKMGREGRKTVEENYSVKVSLPKYLDIFEELRMRT